ncbi:RecF/RecN/SMC protein [Hyphopichia burtonii NRRL Y-1933]|uniref:Structural maintenance of chromosomes protein n=2 Tax=Dikarya TaxID=451864 RepID=A0A1E4RK56_9ASCO|nr:RecF/RecN/SMC protein [Hyphopichia burtonii NRRL Y-1933]ODV67664.1 RecF/RecN/SMC protein [Hyphopichia burtonii NRRL Y-1933]
MGRLIGLELHNFKSYRGTSVIGFGTSSFTSIIGPNGAGKSNMMDAISFVLGVKSSHLRSSNLKDLIYRGRRGANSSIIENTAEDISRDPTKAHVIAIYEKSNGERLNLKRTITANGNSDYKINDKTVTALQYSMVLKAENILIKARNFLVFQGDVEQIAAQSPKDLTSLIETISGSNELTSEYERLKEEQDKAHEFSTSVFSRKRTLNSESKQYKEQLIEQELFENKLTERNKLIKMIHLYKLYHSEQKHDNLLNDLKDKKKELKYLQNKLSQEEKSYKNIISKYSKRDLHVKKIDQQISDLTSKSESKTRELFPIQASRKSLISKIHLCEGKIKDIQEDITKQKLEKKKIEKKLHDTRRLFRQFESKAIESAKNSTISVEAIKEYEELRDEFLANGGSQLEQDLSLLFNEKDLISSNINNYNNQKNNALSRISELESIIGIELKPKLVDLTTELNDLLTLKREKSDMKDGLIKRKEEANFEELELNTQLRNVLIRLDELSSQQRESNKQKKLRENVSMLKNSFKEGAIRGLVYELVRPSQQKFENALLTVLGRNFDAIIVENTSTAYKCIEIMKERRAGVATFIPLDSVVNDPINLNYLRTVHPHAKPAIDIVDFEDVSLEKAIKYVVGDTVVVDTIDTARELKWESHHNLDNKLVTLDGSVIHKSGLMTAGQQENKSPGSMRWDKTEWKALTERKDDLTTSLASLAEERPKEIEINMLMEEIHLIEDKIPILRNQTSNIERKINERKSEIQFHNDLIKELENNIKNQNSSMKDVDSKLNQTHTKIKKLQDKIYSEFSRKHGFTNGITDYENLHGSSLRNKAKERTQFTKTIASLTNQLEFQDDRLRDIEEREKKLREDLIKHNENLATVDEQIESIKSVSDGLEAELDVTRSEKEAAVNVLQESLKSSKSLESTVNEIEGEIKNMNKAITNVGEVLLKVDTERVNILKNCKISSIDIPFKDGFLESFSLSDDTDTLIKEVYDIELDYSLLSERLRENFNLKIEAELQARLESVIGELEQLTPNAKAVERLKEVETKLKSFDKDFTKARQKEQKIVDAFNDVRQRRTDLFMNAFDHISGEIDLIYKELTKSAASPLGGSAYLTLEDEDEPYGAGIKYHAMPPMKRFRDMELLSGGEKTVAALALLFAIHSYQPSPFFVLDEVDAALDNSNVNKVANYLKKYAGPDFQFIVISLKSSLFEKSDALVGIYREQKENSSKTVTLDLRDYPEEETQVPLTDAAA